MIRRWAACSLLLAVLAASLAPAAYAQGCIMCRSSAAAAGEEARKTLDLAIFILLIPTISIFLGVFYWAFLRRDRTWRWTDADASQTPEPPAHELDDAALWRAYRG